MISIIEFAGMACTALELTFLPHRARYISTLAHDTRAQLAIVRMSEQLLLRALRSVTRFTQRRPIKPYDDHQIDRMVCGATTASSQTRVGWTNTRVNIRTIRNL